MKPSDAANEEADMDMTPMIDCVFLLMIFFVLVIDLSQKDLEDLILPKAERAVPDENPPENRPVVNISQSGKMMYRGNEYHNPLVDGDKTDRIRQLLLLWKEKVAVDKEEENIGGRMVEVVNDPVLIRADKWTEWHYIGVFMTACSQPDAAFWKLELALSEEDKEQKIYGDR